MIALTRAQFDGRSMQPLPPLTWDVWLWGPNNVKTALVCCGNGHTGTASPSIHSIAEDGTLSPSWVCPFDDCDWHEFAKLEGWD